MYRPASWGMWGGGKGGVEVKGREGREGKGREGGVVC
jgi:hypothetical protein